MPITIAGTPAVANGGDNYTAETGSNRLVVWTFGAMKSTENAPAISGVTFGGVAMSLAVTSISDSQAFALSSVWYLKHADIPSGAQALVITWSTEPNDTTYLGRCYTLIGVDQTNPLVDTDGAIGSSVASLQGGGLTVEDGGIVIAHASKSNDTDNFNTPSGYTKTSLGNYDFSGHSVVYHKLISGAGTESPSVTFTSANASLSLASFRQVAAGGTINTITAEDVTTIVDAFISLILRLRDATEVTIVSEGGLAANTLHNLLSSDPSDVVDSFLRSILSNRTHDDSIIVIDNFLSSVIGSTVNAVTASDVLTVADGFITILRRMRDAAETTTISEGGLDISTFYNLFVDESTELADSFIRRMLLTNSQDDSIVFTDDFLSSVSGGGIVSSIASDAIQVTWQVLLSAYRDRLESEDTTTVDSALSISLFNLMTSSLISVIDESVAQLKILMVVADTLEMIDDVASVLVRFTNADGSKIRIGVDQPTIELGGYVS